jgi:hypothetical protein
MAALSKVRSFSKLDPALCVSITLPARKLLAAGGAGAAFGGFRLARNTTAFDIFYRARSRRTLAMCSFFSRRQTDRIYINILGLWLHSHLFIATRAFERVVANIFRATTL